MTANGRWAIAAAFGAALLSTSWLFAEDAPPAAGTAGGIVVSKPGDLGITAKVRPLLPKMAAGDPLRLLLHFEKETGPIDHSDEKLAAQMVDRGATLATLEVAVKKPGGAWQLLKTEPGDLHNHKQMLYAGGTFIMEFQPEQLVVLSENGSPEMTVPWKWDGPMAPGEYQIAMRGTLKLETPMQRRQERGKPPVEIPATSTDVAFRTEPLTITVERADMRNQTLAELEAAAIEAVKAHPSIAADELEVKGAEGLPVADADGNRIIRVRANAPAKAPAVVGGGLIIGGGFDQGYWQYQVAVTPAGKAVGFGRARKGFCLARGTIIATPEGDVPVEQLRAGQPVWACHPDAGAKIAAAVVGVFRQRAEATLVINDALRVTQEHPVFVRAADGAAGWKKAGELREGDQLLDARLRTIDVTSIEHRGGEIDVYDVAVDGPHNFFAAGILVHNKSIAWTPQHFVPWYSLWNRAPELK